MTKRYYVVKKGRRPGIYNSWEEARPQVEGFKGMENKSFKLYEDALKYYEEGPNSDNDEEYIYKSTAFFNNLKKSISLESNLSYQAEGPDFENIIDSLQKDDSSLLFSSFDNIKPKLKKGDKLTAYVDGSYNPKTQEYGAGVVILRQDTIIYTFSKKGINSELTQYTNISGEILAAIIAMQYCIKVGVHNLDIYYDFEGICDMSHREPKNLLQNIYYQYCASVKHSIRVDFHKVKSHSGNIYNNLADSLARDALNIGKVRLPVVI